MRACLASYTKNPPGEESRLLPPPLRTQAEPSTVVQAQGTELGSQGAGLPLTT